MFEGLGRTSILKQVRRIVCIAFLLLPGFSFAQITIVPVPPTCFGQTIQLSAVVEGVHGTESYTFEQYTYTPESYDITGATAVVMGDDTRYPNNTVGIPIGFPFCFLNNAVDNFWIGSNGWISFLPNQSTAYVASPLPNPAAPQKAIFSPWQDWDPSVGSQAAEGYIYYRLDGTAPDRKLIVFWKDCPLFSDACNDSTGRFQIVLHETTNIIDNHITLKSTCPSWPDPPNEPNLATQGIQSVPDPVTSVIPFYVAPGRNQTSWHVWPGEEESTHFIPSGITWHEGSPTGPVVGNGDKIQVTATVSTTYWAVLAACDNTGNYQASVAVIVNPLPVPSFITGDAEACQGDIKMYTTQAGQNHYNWTVTGGIPVPGEGGTINDNWIKIQWNNAGTHSLSVDYISPDGCISTGPASQTVLVHAFETPVITTTSDEFCPEAEVTFTAQAGKTNYIWEYATSGALYVAGGGTTENFVTLKWTASGIKAIAVNYTDAGCTADPPVSKQITIKETPTVSGNLSKSICTGANTAITLSSAPAGADFSWNTPPPLCSANILVPCPVGSATGTLIDDVILLNNNQPGTVKYFITPTLNGCAGNVYEFLVNIDPLPVPVISEQAGVPICKDATLTYTTEPFKSNYSWQALPDGIIAGSPPYGYQVTITWPTSGTKTVQVNYTDPSTLCTAANPSQFNTTVNPLPSPGITQQNGAALCPGSPITYVTEPGKINYDWQVSPDGTIAETPPYSNQVTISFPTSGLKTVSVIYTDPVTLCTADGYTDFQLTINQAPTPGIVQQTGVALCPNSAITYTTEPGKNNYTWNVSPDGVIQELPPYGNLVTVIWPTSGAKNVSVNYADPVTMCTAPVPASLGLTVNPLPVPAIFGPNPVCVNSTIQYTTDAGMSAYQWTVDPAFGTFTPDPVIPHAINVNWNATGTAAINVNYTSQEGCTAAAPTALQATIQFLPDPTIISGSNNVCAGTVIIYNTQPNATSYSWNILPLTGRTILSGGSTSSAYVEVRWDDAATYDIAINYSTGADCSAPVPFHFPVTVNPLPTPAITPTQPGQVCELSTQTYSTPPVPGHSYTWTIAGGSPVTGGTPFINVHWGSTGPFTVDLLEEAHYGTLTCSAPAMTFIPDFKPWPGTAGTITGPGAVCNLSTGQIYSVAAIANALDYDWTYSGSGAVITNSGTTVSIDFLAGASSGTLSVRGHNDCGYGPLSPAWPIVVNPLPVASFTTCNDVVTTKNGKPIVLKGGTPYGTSGTYHLNSPTVPPLAGNVLNPGDPLVFTGPNTIYYTYTDANNCKATAQRNINVLPSNSNFPCFSLFTDPRDGNVYHTVPIGTHCWMQENLRYGGTTLPYSAPQTDNCLFERNCLSGDPNCTINGGFYQWDELMQYDPANKAQGFCPPGWHIPNEAEWNDLITAVSGGAGDGIAGAYLKELQPITAFKADPAGIFYLNTLESFNAADSKAAFYWTSSWDPLLKKAVARGLHTKTPSVSRYESSRANAFPVRCVKD